MITFARLKKDVSKKTGEIVVSAAGFLLALAINALVAHHKDQGTYESMLKAVKAEAKSNEAVLEKSYGDFYFTGGIVLKDFSVAVISQSLANPLFVEHLKGEDLELLNQYMRTLTLANSYRRAAESIKLGSSVEKDGWLQRINEQWTPTINEADNETKKVGSIK
jgi:hypothetical protein